MTSLSPLTSAVADLTLHLCPPASCLGCNEWALHPHLTSDHFAITILLDISIPSPPPLPPRFRMQDADWAHFCVLTETSLSAIEPSLSLDEEARYIASSILSAAQASIPLHKTTHHRFRDPWIYGPRVREVNRRLNAARKAFRRHPTDASLRHLQCVSRHATRVKTNLRHEALHSWCQGLGRDTPLSTMWKRVRQIYSDAPPPPPTHPFAADRAEALAASFAGRTSTQCLPPTTGAFQRRLAPSRLACIRS